MITPGTKVSEGQPVMELETDKAVVEVPSSVSGIVKDIKVKEGEKVKVGQVIFTLEGGAPAQAETSRTRNAPVEHVSGQHGARLAFQAAIRAEGKTEEQALPPDQPQQSAPVFTMPVQLGKVAGTENRQAIPAAPHVRRLAREIGVDIYEVKGTGPGGRISEDDVKVLRESAPVGGRYSRADSRRALDTSPSLSFLILPSGARSSASQCAAFAVKPPSTLPKPGTRFHTSRSTTAPTSPNSNTCEPASPPKPKKPVAR